MAVQLVEATPIGDKTLIAAHSQELARKFGWNAHSGNVLAAYLTGFLFGKRAISRGFRGAILDIGLKKSSKGSRVFSVLKGALDAGLDVPHNANVLPDEARIRGDPVAYYAKTMVENNFEAYKRTFSAYLSKELKPESITQHFDQIKNNIVKTLKMGNE
jgi:large subunit ribosomal protein L18